MNTLTKNTSKTTRHPRCANCCKISSTGHPPPQNLPEQSGTYNFTHDNLQRLEQVTKDGTILREYGYDLYGNRTKLTEQGNATSYHFNALNQLISSVDSVGIETRYAFDNRGNLTEVRAGGKLVQSYTFGALDRLEEARNFATEQSVSYSYSALGQRVGQTLSEASNPTKHIEDTLDLTRQYNNLLQRSEDGTSASFIWDSALLVANSSERSDTYLLDYLGSPLRAGSDAFAFDEFGKTLAGDFDMQPFGYTGYQQDSVANTWFAQARHYDPSTGRFEAEDVIKGHIAAPQSLNVYSYCLNRPLEFVDLDGRVPQIIGTAVSIDSLLIGPAPRLDSSQVWTVNHHFTPGVAAVGDFPTPDAAASNFAQNVYPQSLYIRHEYASMIYSVDVAGNTFYRYTSPISGTPHSVNLPLGDVPQVGTAVAFVHTHPNSNQFSNSDINAAVDFSLLAYVIGPNFRLLRFDPETGGIYFAGLINPRELSEEERRRLMEAFEQSWLNHVRGGCDRDLGCENMDWPTP